jgi:LysR family transcriptional regulator for metE and metH
MAVTLDLSILRAVSTIAATRSLTAAADELNCTQSALSHQIAKWERQNGIVLFNRRRRPMELTAAGQLLAERAAEVQALLDDTRNALHAMHANDRARLFITLECHTCIEWLAPTLDRYRREHPAVHLDLRMGASFDPLPTLKAGATDVVITSEKDSGWQSDPNLVADPLFRYQIVALLPRDHSLAEKAYLRPQDFIGQTVITYPVAECRLDLYTRFLDRAGIVPAERRTAELTTMIVQWVSGGVGLAALPRWAIPDDHPQLTAVPLGPDGLWSNLYAVRREKDHLSEHINEFTYLAKRECFSTLDGIVNVP